MRTFWNEFKRKLGGDNWSWNRINNTFEYFFPKRKVEKEDSNLRSEVQLYTTSVSLRLTRILKERSI